MVLNILSGLQFYLPSITPVLPGIVTIYNFVHDRQGRKT